MLNQAADEFRRGHYRHLVLLQSIYDGDAGDQRGSEIASSEDMAHMLVADGVPRESLDTVFYHAVEKDRTYHAALAAKQWFQEKSISPNPFNIATVGPHARRSWLLFRRAFGGTVELGIVALKDPMYDPQHWWRTSEGVREVLGESIAYVYARFFFGWA
jgi:hypothetical protein